MACIAKRRGRYVIDFYDNTGKRRWKTLPQGVTKKKAREALRDIEDLLEKNVYLPNKKIPSFAQVADSWLKSKKPNIRQNTYHQYKGHVENHLKPFYAGRKITGITFDAVESFLNHCQEQKVSIPTTRKILVNLGAIMTYACRKRYIDHNPVRNVEKPKGRSELNENDELNILNYAKVSALLDNTPEIKYKTLFMMATLTGMRQGELFGLKWEDVEWFNMQVKVRRTFNNGRFYQPKTKSSRRKIDLAPQLVKQLKLWKLACPKSKLDLVFPNEAGNPLSPINMVRRKFEPALKEASIDRIRFHDLRHTYASIQIDLNTNIKYLQNQMGHSSIRVTMDTYGHLIKTSNTEAAARLGNAIFKDDRKAVSEI